jgi:hypothetical protein
VTVEHEHFVFSGPVFEWRGPAPYHFVAVPADDAADLKELASEVTYGWGMIPVLLRLGETRWETSLWPKDGGYYVPIKDFVREAEGVGLGDVVELGLVVATRDGRPVIRPGDERDEAEEEDW